MPIVVAAGLALPAAGEAARSDFAVVVDGHRILAVGAAEAMRAQFPDAELSGGSDLIMLPGLVNSHDHGRGLGSAALGLADDLLEVRRLGLANLPRLDPYLAAVYDGLRLIRSGVSLVLHSHILRDAAHAELEIEETLRGYREAGIRVAFDLPISDQNQLLYDETAFNTGNATERELLPAAPPDLDRTAYFDLCERLLRAHHDPERAMVSINLGPSGPQWCSDELMTECVAFARKHGLRMHAHGLETWYQREYGRRHWGKSTVRHLADLGVLGPWLTLAHVVWPEPDDLAVLAQHGVGVAHNPSSNLRLRSGLAPISELLEAGVTLGVGLDSHGLDEDQDFLRELRLAWTLANRPGASARTIDAQAIWRMGTVGGAALTLGPEARLGRLEAGYLADLVLVDRGSGLDDWTLGMAAFSSWDEVVQRLPELLLRNVSHHNVRNVMIDGKWVLWNSGSTGVDELDIVNALRENLLSERSSRSQSDASLTRRVRQFYAGWGGPS